MPSGQSAPPARPLGDDATTSGPPVTAAPVSGPQSRDHSPALTADGDDTPTGRAIQAHIAALAAKGYVVVPDPAGFLRIRRRRRTVS